MTTCAAAKLEQYLGVRFALGGRSLDGIDCLGLTRIVVEMLGRPWPDPWETMVETYRRSGVDAALLHAGMPAGYVRVAAVPDIPHAAPPDGAIALMSQLRRPHGRSVIDHVSAVVGGRLWSAREQVGVYATPWHRERAEVLELWDYREAAGP